MLADSLVEHLIVSCGMAISVVEKPDFKTFIHNLNPKFALPSRQHITYKILPQLVERKKKALQMNLDLAKNIALTLDIWTDRSSHSFLAITAHTFVSCTPLSCLLTFTSFSGSHTGVRIAEEIEKSISEHRLEGKVSYVVTDNASNMKRALDVLKELQVESDPCDPDEAALDDDSLWEDIDETDKVEVQQTVDRQCSSRLSCFAHSLQLVVKDGLEKLTSAPIRLITAKCCKLCNLVHQSALFREAFEINFGSGRSLPKPNDTRWSSTFKHLSAISNLDQVILSSLLKDQNQVNLMFTAKEFVILLELVDLLQPFAEVTELTQGEKYPTIGCVVPSIVALDSYLLDFIGRAVHHVIIAKALHGSLRKRFQGLFQRLQILPLTGAEIRNDLFGDMIYPVASFLDPNFGLFWLDEHPSFNENKQHCQHLKEEIIGNCL